MIVMFIFLILSVVFIIGTVIYINQKKKSNHNMTQNAISQNNDNKTSNNKSKKKLEDILNIKIVGNVISMGNNRYSSIVKLGNIDYNMLSDDEQDTIENILMQTALSIDYPIQFFSTTEYIDTSKVVEVIKENKTSNKNVKEYQNFLINYLQNLMETKSISIIKSYAVISFDGTCEKAKEELSRRTTLFKANLLRAKVVCEVLEENELYNLIYRELNKNSNLKIDSLMEGGKNLYVGKKQK